MIQNKKLFVITLVVGLVLCIGVDVPFILFNRISSLSLLHGIFFIGNAILGAIIYSLIYFSLNKTTIVKKVYRYSLFLSVLIFVSGVAIVVHIIM